MMQTLWARVASATGSCRCPGCLSTAPLTRRTTTSASRRKATASDVFVACYSAIFATAALADANMKESRREQLTRLIREARVDASEVPDLSENRTDGKGQTVWESRKNGMLVPRRPPPPTLSSRYWFVDGKAIRSSRQTWAETIEYAAARSKKDLASPHSKEETIARWQPRDETQEPPEVLSDWKISALEESIAKLVGKILTDGPSRSESYPLSDSYDGKTGGTVRGRYIDRVKEQQRAHERLISVLGQADSTGARKYPDYKETLSDGVRAATQLNQDLSSVIESSKTVPFEGRWRWAVAEICRLLLTSPKAPDASTMSILLKFFLKRDKSVAVPMLIEVVYETRLKPTPDLCATILGIYTAEGQHANFLKFIKLMKGYHYGLYTVIGEDAIRSKGRDATFRRGRYHLVRSSSKGEKLWVEKVRRDQSVFHAQIKGFLAAGRVKQAMVAYQAFIRYGHQATVPMMTDVLAYCLTIRDWYSGLVTWREIRRLLEQAGQIALDAPTSWAYQTMLSLCQACRRNRTFRALFVEAQRFGLADPKFAPPSLEELDTGDGWKAAFQDNSHLAQAHYWRNLRSRAIREALILDKDLFSSLERFFARTETTGLEERPTPLMFWRIGSLLDQRNDLHQGDFWRPIKIRAIDNALMLQRHGISVLEESVQKINRAALEQHSISTIETLLEEQSSIISRLTVQILSLRHKLMKTRPPGSSHRMIGKAVKPKSNDIEQRSKQYMETSVGSIEVSSDPHLGEHLRLSPPVLAQGIPRTEERTEESCISQLDRLLHRLETLPSSSSVAVLQRLMGAVSRQTALVAAEARGVAISPAVTRKESGNLTQDSSSRRIESNKERSGTEIRRRDVPDSSSGRKESIKERSGTETSKRGISRLVLSAKVV